MTSSKRAFIGIDGGGSKTRALAIDSEGRNLSTNTTTGCNPHNVGFQNAADRIDRVVASTCQSLRGEKFEVVSVFCGIAGIRTSDEKAKLAKPLSRFPWARNASVFIDSDLTIAYEAALGDRSGLCLIAGTGAACIAKDASGTFHTSSNRQPDGSEPGSGYGIGKAAIESGLLQEIKGGTRDAVSRQAEHVIELANRGDPKAREILVKNAQALAELAARVHVQANLGTAFPIALAGGLATANSVFRSLTSQYVSDLFPESELLPPHLTPVEAAARLALRQRSSQNP